MNLFKSAAKKLGFSIAIAGSLLGIANLGYSQNATDDSETNTDVAGTITLPGSDQSDAIDVAFPPRAPRQRLQANYRFYNEAGIEHFITNSRSEGMQAGYRFEGIAFYTLAYPPRMARSTELFRCYGGKHFVSVDPYCEGTRTEGSLGFIYSYEVNNSVPLYRFASPQTGDHLITVDYNEGYNGHYQFEGELGFVPVN